MSSSHAAVAVHAVHLRSWLQWSGREPGWECAVAVHRWSCWLLPWLLLVCNVGVVKKGVQSLNTRNFQPNGLRQLNGRTEIRLNLHRPLRHIVLVHDAVRLGRANHVLHSLLLETLREGAMLRFRSSHKLVDNFTDKLSNASLLKQVCVGRNLKKDAEWVECNWSVIVSLALL